MASRSFPKWTGSVNNDMFAVLNSLVETFLRLVRMLRGCASCNSSGTETTVQDSLLDLEEQRESLTKKTVRRRLHF